MFTGYNNGFSEYGEFQRPREEVLQEELEEAEQMIRNGCTQRQMMRKQFTCLGQSDIFKLYRKYGRDAGAEEEQYPDW